jgi:hypothetical protein
LDLVAAIKDTVGMVQGAESSGIYEGTPDQPRASSSAYPTQIGPETAASGSSGGADVPGLDALLLEATRSYLSTRTDYLFEINKLIHGGDGIEAQMHESWRRAQPILTEAFQFLKRKGRLGQRMWQAACDMFEDTGKILHCPFALPPGNNVLDRAFDEQMKPLLESIGFFELAPASQVALPSVSSIEIETLKMEQPAIQKPGDARAGAWTVGWWAESAIQPNARDPSECFRSNRGIVKARYTNYTLISMSPQLLECGNRYTATAVVKGAGRLSLCTRDSHGDLQYLKSSDELQPYTTLASWLQTLGLERLVPKLSELGFETFDELQDIEDEDLKRQLLAGKISETHAALLVTRSRFGVGAEIDADLRVLTVSLDADEKTDDEETLAYMEYVYPESQPCHLYVAWKPVAFNVDVREVRLERASTVAPSDLGMIATQDPSYSLERRMQCESTRDALTAVIKFLGYVPGWLMGDGANLYNLLQGGVESQTEVRVSSRFRV